MSKAASLGHGTKLTRPGKGEKKFNKLQSRVDRLSEIYLWTDSERDFDLKLRAERKLEQASKGLGMFSHERYVPDRTYRRRERRNVVVKELLSEANNFRNDGVLVTFGGRECITMYSGELHTDQFSGHTYLVVR